MKYLLYLLLSLTIISSCAEKGSENSITGKIAGAENLSIYFDKIFPDGSNLSMMQTPANDSGEFSLDIEKPLEEGVYRVRIGVKNAYIIYKNTDQNVNVTGNLSDFTKFGYDVHGSPMSQELKNYLTKFINKEINASQIQIDLAGELDPLVSMQIANILFKNNPQFASTHKAINEKLVKSYPDADFTLRHSKMNSTIQAQVAARKRNGKFKIGEEAPNIELPGPDGKVRRLSDLRGEVVLLDFWASWCGPCRKANPEVVQIYKKYKDQGFNVFSVSLDGIHPRRLPTYKTQEARTKEMGNQRKRWVAAIDKDKLEWDSHVSELKHWNSAVSKLYGVASIPQTFLIDRDGNFAVFNPRFSLEEDLKKLL